MAIGNNPTFTIKSVEDGTIFTSFIGDGAAIVTEGYAGWQITNRPREVGVTEWQGRNPMAIEIPFMIDFYMATSDSEPGIDCENEVQNLEHLCGIGSHAQPPICIVDGQGVIPHDHTVYQQHRWVIEQLSWSRDLEIRSPYSGRRLRCGGTIQIRQFVSARDILTRISPRSRAIKPKTYIVRKGDTLAKIAKRFYGDANMWKRIADANHLRDRRKLKIGQKLKIPR